jgi:putative iron-regulated protein
MRLKKTLLILAGAALLATGCGDNDNSENDDTGGTPTPAPTSTPAVVTAQAVVANYAELMFRNYSAALADAEALHDAIDAFVDAPSQATLDAAKAAWIASRPSYQQTEAARFYNGPIDDPEDGPEGLINAWPLDENYIDYVEGAPDSDTNSGIINDPTNFPVIDEATLREANEAGGEANIATGYHAIEFLLWGQDLSTSGPGNRPFTDYVTDGSGTASNQERRGEYLTAVAHLLLDDLQSVVDEWAPGNPTNYRAELTSIDTDEALTRILTGIGTLSAGELGGERLSVAFETRDQEDEHSCFSDNTRDDLANNALGIQNVYLGRYGTLDGPGIDELVRQVDPALDASLQAQLAASVASMRAIPQPLDQALQGADDSPGRVAIQTAIDDLFEQADGIATAAEALGLTIGTGI